MEDLSIVKLLPSKVQWKKWSLPSKMTAVAFYLTVITLLFSITSYISIKTQSYANSIYNIESKEIPKAEFIKVMGDKYYPRKDKINVKYPRFETILENNFLERINKEIESSAYRYIQDNLEDYEFAYEVGMKSKLMSSVKINQNYYYKGAMNPNHALFAINLDLEANKVISFYDIFDVKLEALDGIKELLKEEINKSCGSLFSDQFHHNSYIPRFFIQADNIQFLFSEYEVTPGICNSFFVNLDYQSVSRFIRRDGQLGHLSPASGSWQSEKLFERSLRSHAKNYKKKNDRLNLKLETEGFVIKITSTCSINSSYCNEYNYFGKSKKSRSSLSLSGGVFEKCIESNCKSDGYRFNNGNTIYFISKSGELKVTQNGVTLVQQQGRWINS